MSILNLTHILLIESFNQFNIKKIYIYLRQTISFCSSVQENHLVFFTTQDKLQQLKRSKNFVVENYV